MKTAREKLLATATKLFYKHGIHAVGVDEIVRQSGVTKMTLYKHFGSKDRLAEAYLEEHFGNWSVWFGNRVSELSFRARKPEDRVLAIFDALEEWFASPDFRGCPLINTVSEISDRKHPVRKIAVAFKNKLLETIAAAVQSLDRSTPDLAEQLLMLIDGAIVRATMIDSSQPARAARKAAAVLLASR
jgi:AcrR family transcriptional regulator